MKERLKIFKITPLNKNYSYEAALNSVKYYKPDLFISAGYDKIIHDDIIQYCPNIVNIHFGMLPKYRGSFSIPWAIINNEEYIGITLHEIDTGIDSGSIIAKSKIPNDKKKSAIDLYNESVDKGVILLKTFIINLEKGAKIRKRPQDENFATYYCPNYPNNFLRLNFLNLF